MLNFNFLNNFKYWGEALHVIENKMPHKLVDFRQSLQENNMDASIWLAEELKEYLEEYYTKQGNLRILILNSYVVISYVKIIFLIAFNILNTLNMFFYSILEFTYRLTNPILN